MNIETQFLSIEAFKLQASILLKNLKSTNSETISEVLKKFRSIDELRNLNEPELIANAKRKHALQIVAIESGYESWNQLTADFKQQLEHAFVADYKGGFLNHWFANYKDAKAYQKDSGGYLLPYKNQFFICNADYIAWLGLEPNDPDWQAISNDWVKPKSYKAWQRLNQKWQAIRAKSN